MVMVLAAFLIRVIWPIEALALAHCTVLAASVGSAPGRGWAKALFQVSHISTLADMAVPV